MIGAGGFGGEGSGEGTKKDGSEGVEEFVADGGEDAVTAWGRAVAGVAVAFDVGARGRRVERAFDLLQAF